MNKNRKYNETEFIETETTSPKPETVEKAIRLKDVFASFNNRDFRYLWIGAFLSNIGTWIQTVAVGYLVFQITGSVFMLGFINFASTLPAFFLAPVGGILADRYERRLVLIVSQSLLMVLALVLGILVSIEATTITAVAVISLVSGIASSVSFPTWLALIPDVVESKNLINAIALNSAQFNTARLIGPATAGFAISLLNIESSFYINAASYLAVLFSLFIIRPRSVDHYSLAIGLWHSFTESLRYTRENTVIFVLLISIAVITIFGISHAILMPAFAENILSVGAKGLGYLMAASGLGAALGALAVSGLSHMVKKRTLIISGMLSLGLFMLIFAFSKVMIISLAAQIGVGVSVVLSTSIINASLQTIAPPNMRGRIMSLFVWAFLGTFPIGSIFMGSIAGMFGSPITVAIGAITLMLAAFFLALRKDLLGKLNI
jgi:MFS family permease